MKEKKQITQQDFERIESYLLDRMTGEEKQIFLGEVENKKALKEELEIQRKLIRVVEAGAFKGQMEKAHLQIVRRKQSIWWLAVAASLAILIAVGTWLINKPSQTERLFAENLTVEPGLPTPMSALNDYDFYDAMVDYKSGEYEIAIEKWKHLLTKNSSNDTLNYFVGIALFNSENYKEAEPYFNKVIKLKSNTYTGKSEWYLALSYLKTDDLDKLRGLSKQSHSEYTQRINQIIQKLE